VRFQPETDITAQEVPRMVASQVAEEVHYPDGRVGLASTDEIADSGYANGDLAPVPIERRTWTTYNYAALWIGMSHCIPTYLLASGLILVGMNWVQALVTIALANLIVLVPMLLNSHAGTKYGIPYPGGAWSAPGQGPFPQDGLIPALKPLYNYNWVVGFGAALLLYWGLTAMSAARARAPQHAYAGDR